MPTILRPNDATESIEMTNGVSLRILTLKLPEMPDGLTADRKDLLMRQIRALHPEYDRIDFVAGP